MTDIIVALIAAGGVAVGAFVKVVYDRYQRRDPVTRGQAEVALAAASLGLIAESRDALTEDVSRLKADRAEDRARIEHLEADRSVDHARITRLETLLGTATGYIESLLRWAQGGATPPAPDIPTRLHDLLDPELWRPPADFPTS